MTQTILAAIGCEFLVQFLPTKFQSFRINSLTPFLMDIVTNAIVAVMSPFVFISVITGILAIDNVDTLSNVGLKIIRRFFLLSLITSLIGVAVSQIFYPVLNWNGGASSFSSEQGGNMILNIIPKNIISPFIDGNRSPQFLSASSKL